MIYKFNNGGIVKLQNAGSIPEYDNIEQIAKYNREHGTNFYKMSQVLEHDKQQALQKSQNKKSFWEILAGHPESSGEAILNKTIETANNAELPETRSKIYNDTGKTQLATTAGSLLTLPMLGEFSTYGLLGGTSRLAGGMTGSTVGSYTLGKAGELGDRTFGTTWMKPAGQIIGGFAGWGPGSNIVWKGAAKIAPNRIIGDFVSGALNKSVNNAKLGISDLQRNIEAGKIGWAPATTKTLWHNSNEPISQLKIDFPAWDITERNAPLGHIWGTGEETTTGFIGNRPYHYSADVTLSKPMIQLNEAIGNGKNASRNEILDFAQKSSADGLHFPNIEDNTLNHQNVYSIFKDVTPKTLNIHFRNPLKKTYSSPKTKIKKLELSEDIMSSDHVLDELNEFESPINKFLNETLQDTPKSFQEKFYKELAKNNPSKKELIQQIPFLLDGNPNKEELSHILQDVVSKYDDRVVPFGYHLDNKGNMKVTPGNAAEIAKTYLGIDKGFIDPDLGMITRASTNGETLSTYKGRQTWMGGFGGQGVTMGYHLSANPQIPGTLFVKTLNPNGMRLKARALKGFQTSQLAAAEKALKANEPEIAAKAIIDLRKVPEAQDNALIQRLMYSYGDLDPTRLSNTSLKTEIEGLKQRINPEASADITRGLRKTFDKKELIIPETLQYDSRHNIYIGDGSAGRFIGGYYSKHKPIDILDGYSLDRWNQYANKKSKFGLTEDPKFIKLLKILEQNGYNINEIKDKITSDVLFKLADEKYPGQPSFLRVNDFGGLFESGRKIGKEPKPFFGINRPSGEVPIVYGINRNYLRENLYPVHRLSPEYKQGGILKAQRGTFEDFWNTLPQNQKDSTDFNVRRYWELNDKPSNFKEAVKRGMYKKEKDGYHANSIAFNEETGEYEFMKSPNHPTIKYELDWFNSDKAKKFRNKYQLDSTSIPWKYVPKEKQGGIIKAQRGIGLAGLSNIKIPENIKQKLSDWFKYKTIKYDANKPVAYTEPDGLPSGVKSDTPGEIKVPRRREKMIQLISTPAYGQHAKLIENGGKAT